MRILLLAVCGVSLWFASGCTSYTMREVFKTRDYADPTEGKDEPWVSRAGAEGRADRPKETADEPRWFREFMMSDRAREIERNVGIYD